MSRIECMQNGKVVWIFVRYVRVFVWLTKNDLLRIFDGRRTQNHSNARTHVLKSIELISLATHNAGSSTQNDKMIAAARFSFLINFVDGF